MELLTPDISVVEPETECPQPNGARRYAVACYGMIGFSGTYLETMLRPWIHHIRWVEPSTDIIIALPRKYVTWELRRLVNFSASIYGRVFLRTPQTVVRSDFLPPTFAKLQSV